MTKRRKEVAPARQVPSAEVQPAPLAPRRRVPAACALGLLCFCIYLTNLRPMGAWDSIPARLLPFSILQEGNLDLNEFPWLFRLNPKPYFLHRTKDDKWFSRYSVALPILVTPLYAPLVWYLDHEGVPPNAVRYRLATVVMERLTAAAIAAVGVALVFLCLTAAVSTPMAVAIALVYAFGTSTWSIGSQALWQHGLAELSLAGLSLMLLGSNTRRAAFGAGCFASLGVLVRPTMVLFALLGLIYVWRERRQHLGAFLIVPVVGMFALLAYNARLGQIVAGGYPRLYFKALDPFALLGLLFGPSHGLLVFTPAAALSAGIITWRGAQLPRWILYLPFGIAGYLLLYSSWHGWWGGHTYGPRFMTDALPAMTLCAAPAVANLWQTRLRKVAVSLLVAWGVCVQLIGVYFDDKSWNQIRPAISSRVWDWSNPQILWAARAGWHGTDAAELLWQALTDPKPALLEPLSADALAAQIEVLQPVPLHFVSGRRGVLRVRITNRGSATWPAFSDYGYLQCKLGYRWWQGDKLFQEAGALDLPRNLSPGEAVEIRAHISAPEAAGRYEIELISLQVIDIDRGVSGAFLRLPAAVEKG